jgi:hypothetical protein
MIERGPSRSRVRGRLVHAAIAFFLYVGTLAPSPGAAQQAELTPLVGDVLAPPAAAKGSDDRLHLVYELRLANATPGAVELARLEIVDGGAAPRTLSTLAHDDIAGRLSIGGRRGAEAGALSVGQFGVLFVHVPIAPGVALPKSLAHRVSGVLRLPGVQAGMPFSVVIGETEVVARNPVVLRPPLRGTGYFAGDGCCDSFRHVRALLPLNGGLHLAQRFAIDWVQVGADKRMVKAGGDPGDVRSSNIYGREVLAVAAGTVVDALNDLPDQVPGKLPEGLPIGQADGNFVVLDIGGGAFVLFAHMQKGSVTVRRGMKVEAGQRLGLVGNSGNTSGPHLHLHVMDGPSPLVSNGIPYVFDRYTQTAIDKAGTADFDHADETGGPLALTPDRREQHDTLPMDLSVVDFPG